MLVDSHCHLDHREFAGEVEAIVARARAAGVARLLSISVTLEAFADVLAIAERYDDVFCTVGVHPHHAAEAATLTVEDLLRPADHPKVVGIGECGLDYYYNRSPKDIQIAVFRTHIAAAQASGLPLVVHTRDADEDTAALLREAHQNGGVRGVLHCFSSGAALAETAVELGLAISFSGILTFKKSDGLREIARQLPADCLLVETDAPYLAPVPMRGKRNEPALIERTLQALAECRGDDPAALTAITGANFLRTFPKVTVR